MKLDTEEIIEGTMALTTDLKKGLHIKYAYDASHDTLTDDFEKVCIFKDGTEDTMKWHMEIYNKFHKNKVDFVLKKVRFITKKTLQIL